MILQAGRALSSSHTPITRLLLADPGLSRRAAQPFTVEMDGEVVTVPAGTLLELSVRQANADETLVGERPLRLCPGRPLPSGVRPDVLGFGEGPHRCPGAFIAIQETDILLQKLLALPVRLESPPELGLDDLTRSYTLRGLRLTLD